MRTFLIFIFVTFVSLLFYNPDLDDFKAYLNQSTEQSSLPREHLNLTDHIFNTDTTTPPEERPTGYSTERNNFLVFSTYRVVRTDDFHEVELGRYLGIATMFFELGNS